MSKKLLKMLIKPVTFALESLFGLEARLAERWAAAANWQLPPRRDLFLHKINLFWDWRRTRNAGWLERGIYSCSPSGSKPRCWSCAAATASMLTTSIAARRAECWRWIWTPGPSAIYAERHNLYFWASDGAVSLLANSTF